jgi:hypothetical protein
MESLSPKQVREIKDLYKNVYKQEVVEEAGDFDDLFESEEFQSLSDELKENIVKKMQDSLAKSEKSGVLGQLERLRRKAFGSEKERTQAINFEKNKNIIDKQKRNIPDEKKNTMNITPVNSKPKDTVPSGSMNISKEGEKQAAVNKVEFKKNKEIEALKKENEKKMEVEKKPETEVKPEVKTEIKPEVKKMHPIEKKNRARFGDAHVDKLKAKNIDFKAMRKGDMTKDDFIKKYPKSITAQKAGGLRDEYEPYDILLDYVLSEGHADTVEEAHYVMTQMDAETIQTIVEKRGIFKSNVLNKKYDKQPEMTEKGKDILPKLNDPLINGKNYNKIFGIGSSSQKALDMLNK